ncbi:MAG: AEC family transporter [bacterium]|nr:AEC family transporter [bacterium]
MKLANIVLPIFLIIGVGYLLRRVGLLRDDTTAGLSRLVFWVAAPSLLFKSTAQYDFDWAARLPLLLTIGGVTVIVALATYLACLRAAPARRGVLAQGAFRGNNVFFGLPVALNALGEGSMASISIIIAFMVMMENLLSILVLTWPHQRFSARDPRVWLAAARRLLCNPLLIGCGLGVLFSQFGWQVPLVLERSIGMVGGIAAPAGLLCVGASLDFSRLNSELRAACSISSIRLALHPVLTLAALYLIGTRGMDLTVPVLLATSPTAVLSYVMAREMEGDASLAGTIVIATTVASLVTVPLWLIILGVT